MLDAFAASHRLGRVLRTDVHVSYLLYAAVGIFVLAHVHQGLGAGLMALVTFLFLGVFVFLHELGHTLAAYKEGVSVQRITLHPLGGLAQMSDPLPGPLAEIQVALAGPFVSLLLAGILYAPLLLLESPAAAGAAGTLLWALFVMNLALALFNLLPVFPLDGGRVLLAALVFKRGAAWAIPWAGRVARGALAVLFLFGLVGMISGAMVRGGVLMALAAVLYLQGKQELQARAYAARYAPQHAPAAWTPPEPWTSSQAHASERRKQPGWMGRRMARWRKDRAARVREQESALRDQVDEVLRKVNEQGIRSLTPSERQVLDRASRTYRKHR